MRVFRNKVSPAEVCWTHTWPTVSEEPKPVERVKLMRALFRKQRLGRWLPYTHTLGLVRRDDIEWPSAGPEITYGVKRHPTIRGLFTTGHGDEQQRDH